MGGSTLERTVESKLRVDLPRNVEAPCAARQALDLLSHRLDQEAEYAVKLLLSELVSNSVKYGGDGPVQVEIESGARGVRVEVIDCGPGFRHTRRNGDLDQIGGWGLVLVEELASRWGSSPSTCRVWFEIDRAAL